MIGLHYNVLQDESVWICYNGEISNFIELKKI